MLDFYTNTDISNQPKTIGKGIMFRNIQNTVERNYVFDYFSSLINI